MSLERILRELRQEFAERADKPASELVAEQWKLIGPALSAEIIDRSLAQAKALGVLQTAADQIKKVRPDLAGIVDQALDHNAGTVIERSAAASEIRLLANGAISLLAGNIVADRPDGTSPEQVADFFQRHRSSLVESLVRLVEKSLLAPLDGNPPESVRKRSGGVTEHDVLNYLVRIKGTWGRKRKPDSHYEVLLKGIPVSEPRSAASLLPIMRERLTELKVHSGADIELQEQLVTRTKYPDSRYEVETHIVGSHKTLLREKWLVS